MVCVAAQILVDCKFMLTPSTFGCVIARVLALGER